MSIRHSLYDSHHKTKFLLGNSQTSISFSFIHSSILWHLKYFHDSGIWTTICDIYRLLYTIMSLIIHFKQRSQIIQFTYIRFDSYMNLLSCEWTYLQRDLEKYWYRQTLLCYRKQMHFQVIYCNFRPCMVYLLISASPLILAPILGSLGQNSSYFCFAKIRK